MQKGIAIGRIRIIAVPQGEAPLEIREAWVGLELPCDPFLGYPDSGEEWGVLSGQKASHSRAGFSVPQDEAIAVLEQVNQRAAQWWLDNGFPMKGKCFGFAEHEAEIVSGITRQQIIEVTDEMMGDPYR